MIRCDDDAEWGGDGVSKGAPVNSGIENAAFASDEYGNPKTAPPNDPCQIPRSPNLEDDVVEFDDLDDDVEAFLLLNKYESGKEFIFNLFALHPKITKSGIYITLFVLYHIYFAFAIRYHVREYPDGTYDWCDDVGLLIILTASVYLYVFFCYAFLPTWRQAFRDASWTSTFYKHWNVFISNSYARFITLGIVLLVYVIFIIIDSADDRRRLVSVFGLFIIIVTGVFFSAHPSRINWRLVICGLGLQFIFGLFILRWDVGRAIFQCLGDKVTAFLSYTNDGSGFVYGYLVTNVPFNLGALESNKSTITYQVLEEVNRTKSMNGVFCFSVLSVIYFFSFIVSMLFHLGVMQSIVIQIGLFLQVTMGSTACESLNAAANIFLGMTEAPMMIKPFMLAMTPSELHAVLTGGFATIAGTVLAAYISFNVSASHLISASVMSAPAALSCAKLLLPETKVSKTNADDIQHLNIPKVSCNLLDAGSQGAVDAAYMVANIAGSLVAVLGVLAFINGVLGWAGELVGFQGLTLEFIFGKIFIPLAWLMGVDDEDLEKVGSLVGVKSLVNEFAAYYQLSVMDAAGELSTRSKTIATYALCGFSNPAAIGIQLGGLGTLVPKRRKDLAKVVFSAYIAGSMASFCTACVAGSLISHQ